MILFNYFINPKCKYEFKYASPILVFHFFVMIQKGFRLIHVFMSLFLDPLYRPLRVQFRVQDLLGNGGGIVARNRSGDRGRGVKVNEKETPLNDPLFKDQRLRKYEILF